MGGFGDLGEGGGLGDVPKKVKLGRKWIETGDEGKSSCEKLRVVLAVLLVVAVCQNTPFKLKYMQQCRKLEFRTSRVSSDPSFVVATMLMALLLVPLDIAS